MLAEIAANDGWAVCEGIPAEGAEMWCPRCWHAWHPSDDGIEGFVPLMLSVEEEFSPRGDTCCICEERLGDCSPWCGWDDEGGLVCAPCLCDELEEQEDDSYGGDGSSEEASDEDDPPVRGDTRCATCDVLLRWAPTPTLPAVEFVTGKDNATYCMPCHDAWRGVREAPAGGAGDAAAAHRANAARNEANIKLLREWFPSHCSHQLYYVHVRNQPSRACTGDGRGGQCRWSHDVPAGLVAKSRGLDLDFEH